MNDSNFMQVLQGILDTLNNISREGLSMKALSDAPSGGGLSAADQALEDAGLDINLDGDDSPKDKKRKRKARKTRRMGRADARSITEPWKDSRVYRTMDMGLGAWNSEQGNERMLQRGAEIEEEGVRSGKKGFQRYGAGLQAASKGISSLQNPSELGGIGDAMSSVGHVVGRVELRRSQFGRQFRHSCSEQDQRLGLDLARAARCCREAIGNRAGARMKR